MGRVCKVIGTAITPLTTQNASQIKIELRRLKRLKAQRREVHCLKRSHPLFFRAFTFTPLPPPLSVCLLPVLPEVYSNASRAPFLTVSFLSFSLFPVLPRSVKASLSSALRSLCSKAREKGEQHRTFQQHTAVILACVWIGHIKPFFLG